MYTWEHTNPMLKTSHPHPLHPAHKEYSPNTKSTPPIHKHTHTHTHTNTHTHIHTHTYTHTNTHTQTSTHMHPRMQHWLTMATSPIAKMCDAVTLASRWSTTTFPLRGSTRTPARSNPRLAVDASLPEVGGARRITHQEQGTVHGCKLRGRGGHRGWWWIGGVANGG